MEYIECERCGKDEPEEYASLVGMNNESWLVCEACTEAIADDIERYDWRERYTEEHHEWAVDLLAEQDEVECVISSYEDGQIIVHTPYVASDVIADVAQFFKFEIVSYGPIWAEQGGGWPCLDEHGSIFQVLLEYNHHRPTPSNTNLKFNHMHLDKLDPHDEQF